MPLKKRLILIAVAGALLALCACAPTAGNTPAPEQATASPTPQATAAPTQEIPSAQELEITGAVVSFIDGAVQVKTTDGRQLQFNTQGADMSGASDIVPGCTLTIAYTGEITGQDASGAQVVSLAQDPEEQHASGTIALFDGREISLQMEGEQYMQFSIEGVDLSLATSLEVGQKATVIYIGDGEERQILRLAQ